MKKGQLKNFRARGVTLNHLSESRKRFNLPSEAAAIKVALAMLHAKAVSWPAWSVYKRILEEEEREKNATS